MLHSVIFLLQVHDQEAVQFERASAPLRFEAAQHSEVIAPESNTEVIARRCMPVYLKRRES